MKRILFCLFALMTMLPATRLPAQASQREDVAWEEPKIILTVVDSTVHIQNAPVNSVLEVYNIVGIRVVSIRLDSSDRTIEFNLPKGYYILKIGNVVRKIVIK